MLLRAIANFEQQSYPNKELVICYPDTDSGTIEIVQKLSLKTKPGVILVERSSETSIGRAKNMAVSNSNGDYICIWDDDDYYYRTRMMVQYNILHKNGRFKDASILLQVLLYENRTAKLYISPLGAWAGTLLCKKELILRNPFLDSDISETESLLDFLLRSNRLDLIQDAPHLYIYIYHGQNVHNEREFFKYIDDSEAVGEEDSAFIKPYILQEYQIN